jgi:hypothetical protein
MTGIDPTKKPQLLFSLVCFDPNAFESSSQVLPLSKYSAKAKKLALKMLLESFLPTKHDSITLAVGNFQTIAIFMCWADKKKKTKHKSIFDYKDTSCLCSLTYFRHEQKTFVLWLSTTLEAPPIESSHCVW